MDWNKDSVADANFAKIDLLSLPVLDQLEEALDLVERSEGMRPDLALLDPEDSEVYDMITEGRSKGVFLLQSPAQLKMAQRLRSRCLLDLAYQVALIRPGRRRPGQRSLPVGGAVQARSALGVRPSTGEARLGAGLRHHRLAGAGGAAHQDVAGMTAAQGRRGAAGLLQTQRRPPGRHAQAEVRRGAQINGVPEETASGIFDKINGHYMFPESHSHAFAVTAYQAAWLKRYHPWSSS